jgi:hypothetical protein
MTKTVLLNAGTVNDGRETVIESEEYLGTILVYCTSKMSLAGLKEAAKIHSMNLLSFASTVYLPRRDGGGKHRSMCDHVTRVTHVPLTVA